MPSLVLALTLTHSSGEPQPRREMFAHRPNIRRELGTLDDDRRIDIHDRIAGRAHARCTGFEQHDRIGVLPAADRYRESARPDRRAPRRRAARRRLRARERRRRNGRALPRSNGTVMPPRTNGRPSTSRCASNPWPKRVMASSACARATIAGMRHLEVLPARRNDDDLDADRVRAARRRRSPRRRGRCGVGARAPVLRASRIAASARPTARALERALHQHAYRGSTILIVSTTGAANTARGPAAPSRMPARTSSPRTSGRAPSCTKHASCSARSTRAATAHACLSRRAAARRRPRSLRASSLGRDLLHRSSHSRFGDDDDSLDLGHSQQRSRTTTQASGARRSRSAAWDGRIACRAPPQRSPRPNSSGRGARGLRARKDHSAGDGLQNARYDHIGA